MKTPGIAAYIFTLPIRFYQVAISPVIHLLPGSGCRYHPTCSEYAIIAIKKHGAIKGLIMGTCRILRCQPFGGFGADAVPDKFSWKKLFSQNKKDVDEESE